jgi:hypothetical protein
MYFGDRCLHLEMSLRLAKRTRNSIACLSFGEKSRKTMFSLLEANFMSSSEFLCLCLRKGKHEARHTSD